MNCPTCNLPLFDYDVAAGVTSCKNGHRWDQGERAPSELGPYPALNLVRVRRGVPVWVTVLTGAGGGLIVLVAERLIG